MDNETLLKITNQIKSDWDASKDEETIKYYRTRYCQETAEQFAFAEYLENFCDKGKTNIQFYGLVDEACDKCGIDNELEELDYQLIWGSLNNDIDLEIDKNIGVDASGLAMIK